MTAEIELSPVGATKSAAGKPKGSYAFVHLLILFVACTIISFQLGLFDCFFVLYGNERVENYAGLETATRNWSCAPLIAQRQMKYDYNYIGYMIAPDLLAVAAMTALLVLASRAYCRMQDLTRPHKVHVVARRRLARLAGVWFVYAFVICLKLVWSGKTFVKLLQYFKFCHDPRPLGPNAMILTMVLSAVAFYTFAQSVPFNEREAKETLVVMTAEVTTNLLDAAHFFSTLFQDDTLEYFIENPSLEGAMIALGCINFIMPGLGLLKLSYHLESRSERKRGCRALAVTQLYPVLLLLIINIPYLVIRLYLWTNIGSELSVFIANNVIGIVMQLRHIWLAIEDYLL